MTPNKYYPVMLDISNKKCVVVGGGQVAERKVMSLLEAGAKVTVVSPHVTDTLATIIKQERVSWISGTYHGDHLEGAILVIASTDSPDVNKQVYHDASSRNIIVNVVDEPALCTFIAPAIHRQGEIVIAVSTSGSAPMVAGRIRDEIRKCIGEEYEMFTSTLKDLRSRVKQLPAHYKKSFWTIIKEFPIGNYSGKASEIRAVLTSKVSSLECAAREENA